jgi:hypothetical protein
MSNIEQIGHLRNTLPLTLENKHVFLNSTYDFSKISKVAIINLGKLHSNF